MSSDLQFLRALAWDPARLAEAIEALARRARLLPHLMQAPTPLAEPPALDSDSLARWVDLVAGRLGIEAEPVKCGYPDADRMVCGCAPAILRMSPEAAGDGPCFLAVLKSNRRWVTLLAPDHSRRRVPPRLIRNALGAQIKDPLRQMMEDLLDRAGVQTEQRARVGAAILAEQLSGESLDAGWLMRLSPAASVWRHALQARLLQPLFAIVAMDLVRQALLLGTWWVIGRGALATLPDRVWWWAWALFLFTGIPFQLAMTRAQGRLATGLGGIFKARLLYGALKLQPDQVRHQGIGQFLGRVLEADAFELLAIGGGLSAIVSGIELVIAAAVLGLGIAGWAQTLALLVWLLFTVVLGGVYWRRNRAWVAIYRDMTNNLVERMVGHRTRLAQADPATWHVDEDRELDHYVHLSERVDRAGVALAAIPRGWMVVGLGGIAVALLSPDASPIRLAVSLGGVLLAQQALASIITGLQNLVAVTQAWDQIAPLFVAAARLPEPAAVVLPTRDIPAGDPAEQPLLVARQVSFRYREHGPAVLHRCSLQVARGDRLLLQGPSGGGKSSLAAVLAGLRPPQSGMILLRGYDRQSVGAEVWRQRIAVAPQFHENHIFTGTFAFNVLMGRCWPPTGADLQEAEEICRELGLGDLIQRMPSGLLQMVGESGWQLSHGERSRLYIARALLQKADLLILDESFAALDPITLERALQCVLRRAPALMVIAHP